MAVQWTPPVSQTASRAWDLVRELQQRLVMGLEGVARGSMGRDSGSLPFEAREWLRDAGAHGGGIRWQAPSGEVQFFNAASSNVSQVHYDDQPERPLGSATALSSIVHPAHPLLPSVHIHTSWTEYKERPGYWRIMADLNPSHPLEVDRLKFLDALQQPSGAHFEKGCAEGDRYFEIPALGRTRGVAHFYLEEFSSGSFEQDLALARGITSAAIDAYLQILESGISGPGSAAPSAAQVHAQITYHTVYFFQVLTLDRGTTAGLLVHSDNDLGILGSLPQRIDRKLLLSWKERLPHPQKELLSALIDALPQETLPQIDEPTKKRLAAVVRAHYTAHPYALDLQARGSVVPRTVENHRL